MPLVGGHGHRPHGQVGRVPRQPLDVEVGLLAAQDRAGPRSVPARQRVGGVEAPSAVAVVVGPEGGAAVPGTALPRLIPRVVPVSPGRPPAAVGVRRAAKGPEGRRGVVRLDYAGDHLPTG